MEVYERINFIQILLTLYSDSALWFFKFPLIVCCILYQKLEEHAECNLSPPEHECNWSVSMTTVISMPDPCRNSIRKSTGLVCTAVCRAACMSQAEANQSRRIHPSLTVYQMSVSYSWGFFVAWFFIYLFLCYGIINGRHAFFSFFCIWLCSGQNLFPALAEKLLCTYWCSFSYTVIAPLVLPSGEVFDILQYEWDLT